MDNLYQSYEMIILHVGLRNVSVNYFIQLFYCTIFMSEKEQL
jgi:hypothetical protein